MRFKKNICNLCMSYMQLHPEKYRWLKCPTCGFSKSDDIVKPKPEEKKAIEAT